MDKFKLENLGSGITAVISKEHGFGTDALLLADFAAVRENNRCCDMGSGCGIIPLLWLKKNMSRPVAAVEISEQGCEQMKKAAEVNSLGGRLEIFNEDLRRVREFLPAGEFDVVTMDRVKKIEEEIESLEEKLSELEEQFQDPAVATYSAKLGKLHSEQVEVQEKLDGLYEEWEALASD